eukprot:Skav222373  [mRNA]  locus=scaffold2692:208197:211346:+ [translate_table: standard]
MADVFRPEIDENIIFRPLNRADLREIAKLQLHRVEERLSDRNIKIDVSEAALDLIAARGYDPTFGARPIKRSIVANVETPLAQKGLSGEFDDGDTVAWHFVVPLLPIMRPASLDQFGFKMRIHIGAHVASTFIKSINKFEFAVSRFRSALLISSFCASDLARHHDASDMFRHTELSLHITARMSTTHVTALRTYSRCWNIRHDFAAHQETQPMGLQA